MIPYTIAEEIRSTLLDYLTTTFSFQDQAVEQALLDFLAPQQPGNAGEGLFKGPYISLRLPFRKADSDKAIPLEIKPAFVPYAHQIKAFERLSARDGQEPQPTLITTGTGSGKTECFLFPILDYCYAHRGEPGIKAIILYPMNALATDQSGRLARILATDERLNGQVTAGMYIGGEGEQRHSTMGIDHLIDDRNTLRKQPPDILLTNYRMLDFLLLRPEDKTLWAENTPETLRFLVLDELHTYDGAQGSDVACLIRRLKARLHTPDGMLCSVGTSATVASDQGDTRQLLIDYAGQIFGHPFSGDSVIVEDRLGLDDFFPEPVKYDNFPSELEMLPEISGESYDNYIQRQIDAWSSQGLESPPSDAISLADFLRSHGFLRALLSQMTGSILSQNELIERLKRWDLSFANYSQGEQILLLQSFISLVSHARVDEDGLIRPFLTCQVQLWVREISRLMREVSAEPHFFWRDDVPLSSERRGMPAYFCRECGHSGWITIQRDGDDYLVDDFQVIYTSYFSNSKNIRYMYPRLISNQSAKDDEFVCPSCLTVSSDSFCRACHEATVPVNLYVETSNPRSPNDQAKDTRSCPSCGTDEALSIVGSQAASLSSVAISQLYTTPLNQDKKLLAFTDSVQDASHRASFFEARTYRFSLRTAIQSTIPPDGSISLDTLSDQVLSYWRQSWSNFKHCDQRLVATFTPPDLHDLPDYENYMNQSQQVSEQGSDMSLPIPSELDHILQKRLSWEVLMEYGFTARVGRSLEKVGSSVAYIDPELIDRSVEQLTLLLPEEIGSLVGLDPKILRHFIVGILERTRTRGGIEHPFLNNYAQEQGNSYLLIKKIQPLLSPFHKNSPRFPRFLTDTAEHKVFDLYISGGSRRTWYVNWAQKNFGKQLGLAEINELYRLIVQSLTQNGLLKKHTKGTANSFGLIPKHIFVTKNTTILKCDQCGNLQTIAEDELDHWLDNNCVSYRCQGKYSQKTTTNQHYYREVYQRGQVERIFAREHTGLLRRETRENIENQFKQQTRADATNLLAATPTLELGIDIGDLSSTLACSVPPAPTNYLQRIGRAGRKTGNSLILILANAKPHDLYFFEEPLEMMAGTITPPGCYLDAPDMLKRQFLAYCMDTWTATDPKATLLPHDVQKMLAGLKKNGFPENLFGFFKEHRQELVDRFLEIFKLVISSENQERLREYYSSDSMLNQVRNAIVEVDGEREELRKARKDLKIRRDKIEADPAQFQDPDKEIKRLEQDMELLLDMIKRVEDQYILNFFTDAGLLPNFAFPETGVRLVGVISGVEKSSQYTKNYVLREYVRPASMAINEIAPFNHFYAEGHKLTVSHIDIAGREKAIERWQFCDQCSHMELVQASHYSSVCPVCGSTIWSDHGQQHDMIRFRKATAYVESNESRVSDDGDDREREYYNTNHFFEMDPSHSRGAYLISSLPFGIEYLDQVTLREINFGPKDTISQSIPINGEDRPQQGFKSCRDCGLTITANPRNDNQTTANHTRNCASSTSAQNLDWENLYLYRTVTSEAIRILLPVSTILVDEKIATFEACLDLGLRKKFGGNPDHLHILSHTEPAEDGSRRRYLVIYDSVPGGTGFLKDLARPENFFDILQLALNTLVSCNCRLSPEKQACYRCLYSYRFQRELKLISRQLGVEMLSEILNHKTSLETIPSLSHTQLDSLIESELEQRFVYTLEKYCKGKPESSFTSIIFNGKQSWELKIYNRHWILEPQVLLGSPQNIAIGSRADFVLWPQNPPEAKPIALFMDGYAYHVKPEAQQGNVADDIYKRRAIISSKNFIVWSIVWDDVRAFENEESLDLHFFNPNQINKFEQSLTSVNNAITRELFKKNSVELLLDLLANPNLDSWVQVASLLVVAAIFPPRPMIAKQILEEKTEALLYHISLPDLSIPNNSPSGDDFYSIISKNFVHLLVDVPKQSLQEKKSSEFVVTLRLEDQQINRCEKNFRLDWHNFWYLTNLLQFLPGFSPVSAEYIQLNASQPPTEMPLAASYTDEWNIVFKFAASDVLPLLTACQAAHLPSPEVGYELTGSNGKIIAFAELAWEDRKVAVFLPTQDSDRQYFMDSGWYVFAANQVNQILGQWADEQSIE
jgi:DEAD/DEAH box helicase domain-containing protein